MWRPADDAGDVLSFLILLFFVGVVLGGAGLVVTQ
jgi:hypothetical protein